MADFLASIMPMALPVFAIAVIAFIVYEFLDFKKKSFTRPVSRSEIQRKKFIERMRPNGNQYSFNWLYRGSTCIGKIISARSTIYKGNPSNHLIMEMVIKPKLIWKFVNPLAKEQAFQINYGTYNDKNELIKYGTEDVDKLVLPSWISFDFYFGIYYDITIAREHTDIIKRTDLMQVDYEEFAAVAYVKAQEMSTLHPPYAHDMAWEEKKIQEELAKKRGSIETA